MFLGCHRVGDRFSQLECDGVRDGTNSDLGGGYTVGANRAEEIKPNPLAW
jgi:hypothetical protein